MNNSNNKSFLNKQSKNVGESILNFIEIYNKLNFTKNIYILKKSEIVVCLVCFKELTSFSKLSNLLICSDVSVESLN